MAHKITDLISEEQLERDLEKYRKKAIELGATDAKIIPANMTVIDERVVAKCTYPKCPSYGTNINFPPYAMRVDEVRKVINNFRYGILIKIEVPPEHTAGKEAIEKKMSFPYSRKLAEITAKIESEAFYEGYHLALAFGSGSCKRLFCGEVDCRALVLGQACPHRLKARSSVEAVGMDVYTMATKVGWEIYAIGDGTLPSEVPFGLRLGLVFIT